MHSSSGFGAIAQLGERVLCKHEVVGSIPSGSTTRFAFGLSRGAAKTGEFDRHRPRKHHFASLSEQDATAGFMTS